MTGLESLGLPGLFLGTFLAATVLPFSSDALYVAALMAGLWSPVAVLTVATLGNWLGGVTTYLMGRLAKWEWVERIFRVSREKLQSQKAVIDKWGVWAALVSWVPFIGDIINLALGFYKTPAAGTLILLLVGKFLRFVVWTLIILNI